MIGIYQIKQAARRFIREKYDDYAKNGDYVLYMHKQEADILRVKSRHILSKQYQFWFWYEENGFDRIKD